jgi:hypothetical protein
MDEKLKFVVVFYLYPTTFPRPELVYQGINGYMLKFLHSIDTPNNCMPSLHVGMSFLVSFAYLYEQSGSSDLLVKLIDENLNKDSNINAITFITLSQNQLNVPDTFSLFEPSTSPNDDRTPTILVEDLSFGDIVTLYTDSSCLTSIGTATSSSDTVNITTDILLENGLYTFYLKLSNESGNSSDCSNEYLT